MALIDFPVAESGYHTFPNGPAGWNEALEANFQKTADDIRTANEQLDKKVSDGGYGEWTPIIYGTDGIIPEQVGSGTYRIIGKTAKLRGHIALSSTNDMAGANLINTPFPIIHREPQAMGTVIMGNFSTPIGYSFPVMQTTSSSIISVAWCGSEELKISRLYGVSLRDNTTIYFDIDVELP